MSYCKGQRLFLLILTLILWQCKENSTNGNLRQNESDESIKENSAQDSRLGIEDYSYKIKMYNTDADGPEMPQTDIYLYPSKSSDSIFLARDVGARLIEDLKWARDLGFPNEFDFAIRAYYAGGGNHYYGRAEKNVLKVYKSYKTEPHPDNTNTDDEEFKLFKTFTFYHTKVDVEEADE